MQVVPGIHQIPVPIPESPLGNINCYLIKGEDGWTLIDTGWSTLDSFNTLEAGLKSLKSSITDISTVIITHAHPDHCGLVGKLKHLKPGTRLLMHRSEADFIEEMYIDSNIFRAKTSILLRQHGAPEKDISQIHALKINTIEYSKQAIPDLVLYGGETIDSGIFKLEIIWTPGHSSGHICLYEPKNRLLFSGDHILPVITPNISFSVRSGDNPLGDYLNALHKLTHLPVSQILPAHEQIFTDLNLRIQEIIDHHKEREADIGRIIGEKTCSSYDIASRLTWNIPGLDWEDFSPFHKRFAILEAISHLEYMRWEGKLEKIYNDNNIYYRRR